MSHLLCFATLAFVQGLWALVTNTPLDVAATAYITGTLVIHKAVFSTE